ncbi:MAG: HD domain-containing protein [archaeon]|nr:HD domain-containing protein [archaeon]
MKINDIVYGEHEFTEPVLIDLINSHTIQRLKGISQFGLPDELYHKKGFTRYDHSLGVTILISKLNGSLKEQIAGLMHDMSHTAFSHLIDLVWGDPEKEDFQDSMYTKFLYSKEIVSILNKHTFDAKEFENLEDFSILEQHIPMLCADRVDYCLREIATDGEKEKARELFSDLTTFNRIIHFKSEEKAFIFGKYFLNYNNKHWGEKKAKTRYTLFSEALREAIELKLLTKDDFFNLNEKTIIEILERNGNEKIKKIIQQLRTHNFEFVYGLNKKRYVDPLIYLNGKSVELSQINKEYARLLEITKNQ